jgi:hypothetical protein
VLARGAVHVALHIPARQTTQQHTSAV